ncbi:ATP-binding cassette domain-containing protein [Haloferax mediterranei ATCC 33500]|uniref:ATP-binding cassette domain-containing protein n=1 Tax=Haloferax mediterranei (strain ATCC 33500 / DSM 1411 / JCM 8866 / NBRC 14739 / NCIMB 2177 / R-4) TaxID=523841 RepID=I3R5M4_HALMT|nr:ATP-binding cassette domain-containing protein [Haloferax mediterranei]AFK19534.1 branched-chain amino acid ABC transporter ATP-binding protein [Haloferax mediterranei ATCC 33500]AHZ22929.1 branched-chain amino acid ABC transporter ATP-binding protein [Haloferax mediterranei ATCC 33500]ELZ99854.1 branched-chain amino acid ABC transporter ATP-binding protein [Haloferax mediterranei ATCC 33500]MDX5987724.1 ATP-binding cassette domain-containing protein [Haloferax mediterranei ATCC 33500]QCQ74
MTLLELTGVDASVAGFDVTHDVSLTVGEGEAVGLVGRNGAGKTTTFRSIMGLADVTGGSIRFRDEELTDLPADRIPGRGLGYQPEDRKLFTGMTVDENLRLPIWSLGDERGIEDEDAVVDDVYEVFPELEERREANVENLSGGQAKMTAVGRALALQPDLLLLDEPLEGLAPVVVSNLKQHITAINDLGIAVLVAESNATHVPDVVDRIYVIERGEIVASGDPNELVEEPEIQKLMQGSGM